MAALGTHDNEELVVWYSSYSDENLLKIVQTFQQVISYKIDACVVYCTVCYNRGIETASHKNGFWNFSLFQARKCYNNYFHFGTLVIY